LQPSPAQFLGRLKTPPLCARIPRPKVPPFFPSPLPYSPFLRLGFWCPQCFSSPNFFLRSSCSLPTCISKKDHLPAILNAPRPTIFSPPLCSRSAPALPNVFPPPLTTGHGVSFFEVDLSTAIMVPPSVPLPEFVETFFRVFFIYCCPISSLAEKPISRPYFRNSIHPPESLVFFWLLVPKNSFGPPFASASVLFFSLINNVETSLRFPPGCVVLNWSPLPRFSPSTPATAQSRLESKI